MNYFDRKLVFRFLKKKKIKNNKLANIYNVRINRKKGFYFFVSPYHLFSQKRFTYSLFKYGDYGQTRYAAKTSKNLGSYNTIFWNYVLLCFVVFDLYLFSRIFRRSIEREPHLMFDKYYKNNVIESSYSYDLRWTVEGWAYFDLNGVHKWTWWCFAQYTESYFNTIGIAKKSQNTWKVRIESEDNSFLQYFDKFDSQCKTKNPFFDFLEIEQSEASLWYSIGEELNILGSPLVQTLIFPDSVFFPIDWWFFFFL